jgi:hypothetical protein
MVASFSMSGTPIPLNFSAVAAHEGTTSSGRGVAYSEGGTCHADLCDAGQVDRRGYPKRQGFPQAPPTTRVPLAKALKTSSAPSAGRVNQDLRDVCEKNVLTKGRSAVLPHCGHAVFALACSLMERVMLTSRRQLSQ